MKNVVLLFIIKAAGNLDYKTGSHDVLIGGLIN